MQTLGDVRNLLAGLRCPVLEGIRLSDKTRVEVAAGEKVSKNGKRLYVLAVELWPRGRQPGTLAREEE
jgi:hypothetical protein